MKFSATPCENCRGFRQTHLSGFMSVTHRRHSWEPLKAESDPVLGPTEHEYWGTHVAHQALVPPWSTNFFRRTKWKENRFLSDAAWFYCWRILERDEFSSE